jgi:plasmid stabilization system protein ParE
MKTVWTSAAWSDVDRLHAFLAEYDPARADATLDRLVKSPEKLLNFARRGQRVSCYGTREVRELRIGRYLLRYELAGSTIFVLRFFHSKEDRS